MSARILYMIPDPSSLGGMTTISKMLYRAGVFDNKVNRHFTTSYKSSGKLKRAFEFLFRLPSFIFQLFSFKPDVIFIMSNSYLGFFEKCLYAWIGRIFGRKVILNHVGGQFDIFYNKNILNKMLIHIGIKGPHVMLVATSFWVEYFKRLFPKLKILNSPNPIFTSDYNTNNVAGENERFITITLSRLVEEKGLLELIEVIDQVCEKRDLADFVIVGKGNMLPIIESKLEKWMKSGRVRILGFVDDDVKVKEITKSDLYILLTHIDVMPISIMEAMAAKKPIISTPVGGIPDLVTDQVNGYMVQVGEIQTAVDRLIYLIDNRDLAKTMGERSREMIDNEYEVAAVINLYNKVAKDLINSKA